MHHRSEFGGAAARVCELVSSLPIPTPWNLSEFVDTVAAHRGKPIQVIARAGLSDVNLPCGLWIGRANDDIIVFDDTTSTYHAEQIVLHELGHVLLDHGGAGDTLARQIQRLLPDIDPGAVQRVLGRSGFDNDEESQAELFASLVMSKSRRTLVESALSSTFFRDAV